MNWAASHLASRKALRELNKMDGFYRQKEGRAREILQNKGKDCFRPGLLFLRGKVMARGLMAIILLVLISKFQINC